MKIARCLIALALVALVSLAQAARCTPPQRVDYARSGYGPADIDKMCGGADAGNAMDLFAKAYNAKPSGDLRTSQQLFEQGLRMDPNNADARRFLAEVKEALSAAQKLFERAYNAKQAGDLKTA